MMRPGLPDHAGTPPLTGTVTVRLHAARRGRHDATVAGNGGDAVVIRTAGPSDADPVGELTRAVYTADGYADPVRTPEYLAELSDGAGRVHTGTVLVAESGGGIVGTVTAATAGSTLSHVAGPRELEVRMLAVTADARRRGVGAALVAACEELAAELGCTAVVLSTEPGMASAQRLYTRLGYVRTPHRDWTVGGVALLTFRRSL